MSRTALVWFRRDLRLEDNPAWAAATRTADVVVAIFIVDPELVANASALRLAQLHANLVCLDEDLRGFGGRLLIRVGDPADLLAAEARRFGATSVHFNRDVSGPSRRRDERVRVTLGPCEVDTHWGTVVATPGSITTKAGSVPHVFGAFHRRWLAAAWDPWPEPESVRIADDPGDGLDAFPVVRAEPICPPGATGARQALDAFLDGPISRYRSNRDLIDLPATSAMSVHLKFGTISPRTLIDALDPDDPDHQAYARQLAWRDWFAHLLVEEPARAGRAIDPRFDELHWRSDPDDFQAWCEGRTGFPIVDAAMRALRATGTMHNRARLITASFLVKDLLIDWRLGERYFRRLLVDGDLSQNVGNWQWVAGTGPDAAPYFRIFNPVTQSKKFDPHGRFLRRWLPELEGLDATTVHAPWTARPLELAAAGIELGVDYPEPIVDHAEARLRALAVYGAARRSGT